MGMVERRIYKNIMSMYVIRDAFAILHYCINDFIRKYVKPQLTRSVFLEVLFDNSIMAFVWLIVTNAPSDNESGGNFMILLRFNDFLCGKKSMLSFAFDIPLCMCVSHSEVICINTWNEKSFSLFFFPFSFIMAFIMLCITNYEINTCKWHFYVFLLFKALIASVDG